MSQTMSEHLDHLKCDFRVGEAEALESIATQADEYSWFERDCGGGIRPTVEQRDFAQGASRTF